MNIIIIAIVIIFIIIIITVSQTQLQRTSASFYFPIVIPNKYLEATFMQPRCFNGKYVCFAGPAIIYYHFQKCVSFRNKWEDWNHISLHSYITALKRFPPTLPTKYLMCLWTFLGHCVCSMIISTVAMTIVSAPLFIFNRPHIDMYKTQCFLIKPSTIVFSGLKLGACLHKLNAHINDSIPGCLSQNQFILFASNIYGNPGSKQGEAFLKTKSISCNMTFMNSWRHICQVGLTKYIYQMTEYRG